MTIGELIIDLLKSSNLSNQEIVDKVKAQFPDAKTTTKSVASVASVARKYGVDVAKRPAASPSAKIAELEAELAIAQREVKLYKYLNERKLRAAA